MYKNRWKIDHSANFGTTHDSLSRSVVKICKFAKKFPASNLQGAGHPLNDV